jgi:DUF1680 family protein
MWLKDEKSLVNAVLGPSEVTTQLHGKPVTVRSVTSYPHDYSFRFTVTTSKNHFSLRIRKPEGIARYTVSESYKEEDGFIVIEKNWNGEHEVSIIFYPDVQTHHDVNNETYFTYGAMVLALPISGIETKTRSYSPEGFHDLNYEADNLTVYQYVGEPVHAIDHLRFKTILLNPNTQKAEPVILMPMGNTILRQTTFKQALKQQTQNTNTETETKDHE